MTMYTKRTGVGEKGRLPESSPEGLGRAGECGANVKNKNEWQVFRLMVTLLVSSTNAGEPEPCV